jgi:hypothetical protein
MVFGISLELCIKSAGISNYIKYKISASEAEID